MQKLNAKQMAFLRKWKKSLAEEARYLQLFRTVCYELSHFGEGDATSGVKHLQTDKTEISHLSKQLLELGEFFEQKFIDLEFRVNLELKIEAMKELPKIAYERTLKGHIQNKRKLDIMAARHLLRPWLHKGIGHHEAIRRLIAEIPHVRGQRHRDILFDYVQALARKKPEPARIPKRRQYKRY